MLEIIIKPPAEKPYLKECKYITEQPEAEAIKYINLYNADAGSTIILQKNKSEIYRRELK